MLEVYLCDMPTMDLLPATVLLRPNDLHDGQACSRVACDADCGGHMALTDVFTVKFTFDPNCVDEGEVAQTEGEAMGLRLGLGQKSESGLGSG